MATFRKRGKAWQVMVRKAGAQPQSATFPTKAAAQRWATRLEAAIDDGRSRGGRAATGTLGELIERYEREVGAIAGFGKSKASSLGLVKARLGKVQLRDLDAGHVVKFAQARHAAGAGPVTVGIDLSYLGTVLRTARGLWRLGVSDAPVSEARDALRMVGLVGRPQERDRRPTQAELEALFAHWRENARMQLPMVDLVQFAIASALRCGEICRIQRDDLREQERTIIIRDRKDPRRPRDQLVPLLDVTGYDALALMLRQPQSADGRIFPHRPASVGTAFASACEKLGIDGLTFHDLRHEGTSRCFEAGMPLEQVALVTGHRSWAQLRRYTNLRPAAVSLAWPAKRPTDGADPRR